LSRLLPFLEAHRLPLNKGPACRHLSPLSCCTSTRRLHWPIVHRNVAPLPSWGHDSNKQSSGLLFSPTHPLSLLPPLLIDSGPLKTTRRPLVLRLCMHLNTQHV
jgi:hypothetical protein